MYDISHQSSSDEEFDVIQKSQTTEFGALKLQNAKLGVH